MDLPAATGLRTPQVVKIALTVGSHKRYCANRPRCERPRRFRTGRAGGLSLGEGGDGSKLGTGAFSEGVVIAAVTSDATDNLMQANITSVYGK
jgi:Alpha-L-arabinofuranosidase B, catalytic